jgi:hypothetical protein
MKGLVSHLSRAVLGVVLIGLNRMYSVELYENLSSDGLLQSFQSPVRMIFELSSKEFMVSLINFVSLSISSVCVLFAGK